VSLLFSALGLALVGLAAAWALTGAQPLRKRLALRNLVLLVAVLLTSVPLSVVLTLFLLPFWRWLEATYGIESIGHSGPAEWCYVVTFLACLVTLGWGGILAARRRKKREKGVRNLFS